MEEGRVGSRERHTGRPAALSFGAHQGRQAGAALLLLGGLGALTQPACHRAPSPEKPSEVVAALQQVAGTGRGLPGLAPAAEERAELRRLYEAFAYTPLWLTPRGNLRRVGSTALERLNDADADGLERADYAASQLDSLARQLGPAGSAAPQLIARLDAGLSLGMLRYLRHLHTGRVNPRSIGLAIAPPREHHDYVALLGAAVREGGGSLDETIAMVEPPLAQYRLARAALARYRARLDSAGPEERLQLNLPLKPGASAPAAQLDALTRRLLLTGDLPSLPKRGAPPAPSTSSASSASSAPSARYEGALVDAVFRFQTRHGLKPDSVLRQEAQDELNVPLAWRAHQLELSLERLRWLGDLDDERFVLVNIPTFELTAWSSPRASGLPEFRTGVIVGKALDTETPVLLEEMRYLMFRPYWNIPPSIVQNETLPAIDRDPGYLRKNNLEIVDGQGDDAEPVEPSDRALDRLARGELRIRQRPGPGNSLGLVKFVFPNDQNVYLHGTPAEELFDRSRRDFSHGCVRVEDPIGLAEWVLGDQREWTRHRIVEAMNDAAKVSRRVNLTRPLSVVLFYTTAVVEPDGTVRFARDIYGHDRRLDQALHRPRS